MSAVMADPAVDDVPVTRRPKKKLIVIGAAVLAGVLALGAGTIVVLKQRAAHASAAADEDATSPEASTPAAAAAVKGAPFYLPLDPFIVNLADREADRYLQIGVTFELDSSMTGDQIKAFMPAIRNAVLMLLANKTSKDLLSREGKEQLALAGALAPAVATGGAIVTGSGVAISMPIGRTASRWISSASCSLPSRFSRSFEVLLARIIRTAFLIAGM